MPSLHTPKFRLTPDGRLEVYDDRLATRINRYLRYYDGGAYTFEVGEEGLFKLSQIETTEVLRRFLVKKSTQPAGAATPVAEVKVDE